MPGETKEQTVYAGDFALETRRMAGAMEGGPEPATDHNGSSPEYADQTQRLGVSGEAAHAVTAAQAILAIERRQHIDDAYGGMDGAGGWA